MESKYTYGGTSDIGYNRSVNEDYFLFRPLSESVLLVALADGMGSLPGELQPAAIVCNEAAETVQRLWDMDETLFLENPEIMLREALYSANRVLGMFKVVDEEKYAGFNSTATLLLVYENTKISFAHVGNCRINLLRAKDGAVTLRQLTTDHTRAMSLFEDGIIDADDVSTHPDRSILTSSLGLITNFQAQSFSCKLKDKDILLLTTDGVHYGIRPDAMANLVLQSHNWKEATTALTEAAKMEKNPDNASAVLVFL